MYCHAFSTTFTAVRCFQLSKKVLRLDVTSYQSSDRSVQHLCLWLQNELEGSSTMNSHLTQGGRTTMMPMPVNQITSQCKIKLSQKYCPWINLQLWNFCHSFLQWMGSFFLIMMFCSAIHVYTDRFADMGIIVIRPPGWGANSSQRCRSCSFSGQKQRRWTVLSELGYKIAYNPKTFFLNWKQRTAGKAVEDALQYTKMYEAGVWTKTGGTSHSTSEQGLEQFIVLLKLKSTFQRIAR